MTDRLTKEQCIKEHLKSGKSVKLCNVYFPHEKEKGECAT